MDNKYFENVINEMKPFLDENSFKEVGDCFENEKLSVKVAYSEERQMYTLAVANIEEAASDAREYREVNAWLFDDSQNAKDAISVGIDFTVSLRKELGIKSVRKVTGDIELPSASKSGNMTVSGFAKKMLDIFPSLKDEYKAHIATYGNFLYLNFFGEHLVPNLKNLFNVGTKKQIKKLYDVLEDAYIKGDNEVINTEIALLCAASYQDEAVSAAVKEMLADNSHFLMSYNSFVPAFARNKKLISALIK